MSMQKLILKNGETKWKVRLWTNGRGSKRVGRVFDKKSDAQSYLAEVRSRVQTLGQFSSNTPRIECTTFAQEAEAWLDDGNLRFSASHLKRVNGVLTELLPKIGSLSPDRFTPMFLSSLQRKMKDQGAKNLTVNRKMQAITAILNFSVKQRRIPFNPSTGFRTLPSDQAEMKFWDRSEAESFLHFANRKHPSGSETRWVYVVYLLALNTGLRAGEIWGLQPRDLLNDNEILFIRRQFDRVKKEFSLTKGKKPRQVPCHEDLKMELERLIKSSGTRLDQTVFHGSEGKPINHDSFVGRRFEVDMKCWGGRRIRFHDLRHTATTLMIGQGIDLKTVKEICGHKDVATTMLYAHLLGDNLRQVARSFSIKPNGPEVEQSGPRLVTG